MDQKTHGTRSAGGSPLRVPTVVRWSSSTRSIPGVRSQVAGREKKRPPGEFPRGAPRRPPEIALCTTGWRSRVFDGPEPGLLTGFRGLCEDFLNKDIKQVEGIVQRCRLQSENESDEGSKAPLL